MIELLRECSIEDLQLEVRHEEEGLLFLPDLLRLPVECLEPFLDFFFALFSRFFEPFYFIIFSFFCW